jgi:hypothetical protein
LIPPSACHRTSLTRGLQVRGGYGLDADGELKASCGMQERGN